ncbi:MAG: GNAT family N-acetyltransferase [Patescibacteria group bacterium]
MNISIRDAKPEDIAEVTQVLYKTWLSTYPNEFVGITREDIEQRFSGRFTDEALSERAEKIKNLPSNQRYLVAVQGDKIVGQCLVTNEKERNFLNVIYVLPEHQGSGIGKKLWEEASHFLNRKNDTELLVASYNDGAINFYKSLGFIDTGEVIRDEKYKMGASGTIMPELKMILPAKQEK